MSEEKYDVFVIGAGSGGVRAARIASQHGAKVGIAESKDLGGTCVNVGCVPKKLMVYASEFSRHFQDAKNYGWDVGETKFAWKTLIQNKDDEIKRLNGIYENILKNNNVDLYRGHAKFVDENTIDIDGTKIKADRFLIATGGKPVLPDIPGKEHLNSSDDMFYLDDLPKRVIVIGAGYIGVEFAGIFSGLGADVTLFQRRDKLLTVDFDEDIRDALTAELDKRMTLKLGQQIVKVEKNGNELTAHTDKGEQIKCGMILAATGRKPLTENLGLENTGVKTDKSGRVESNTDYQTDVPHIYAVGDVTNHHNLTPVAINEGHALMDRLIGHMLGREVHYNYIATAVFSQPPIGVVGMTEQLARDLGHDVQIFKSSFRPMRNTISGRDEKTLMKLVVDKKTDIVLGFHMIGDSAPEIIQLAATLLQKQVTKAELDQTIGVHPTAAEEFVTMRTPEP